MEIRIGRVKRHDVQRIIRKVFLTALIDNKLQHPIDKATDFRVVQAYTDAAVDKRMGWPDKRSLLAKLNAPYGGGQGKMQGVFN